MDFQTPTRLFLQGKGEHSLCDEWMALMVCAQKLFGSFRKRHHHFDKSERFFYFKHPSPSPPLSRGAITLSHETHGIFLFDTELPQKNVLRIDSSLVRTLTGALYKEK